MTDDAPAMTAEEKRDIFKQRFAEVMIDMGRNVHKDGETLYLIGSLAARLVDRAKVNSWEDLKAALSQEAYSGLLTTFEKQANEHARKGNDKAAYAIEILAISTICKTQNADEQIRSGEEMLDKMIGDTIMLFRRRSGQVNTAPQVN